MHHTPRQRFTLIELLVVMVVIAILASMLMPAMQGAKNTARLVHCISNIRQLAIAAGGIYPNDNDRIVVPGVGAGPTTRLYAGAVRDQGMYGVDGTQGYSVSWLELIQDKTVDLSANRADEVYDIAYCPDDESHVNPFGKKGWWFGFGYVRQQSYALNHNFTNAQGINLPAPRYLNYVRITRALVPRETVLIAETHYSTVWGARPHFVSTWPGISRTANHGALEVMTNEPQSVWPDVGAISLPRHGGRGFNVAFTDLHVAFIEHDGRANSPWKNPISSADIAEMEKHWLVDYE
jgi:prepilin-type N-terminal cleavage/methylation domain-containing protein/prepilin-type processing-associated H-X9-DG protein